MLSVAIGSIALFFLPPWLLRPDILILWHLALWLLGPCIALFLACCSLCMPSAYRRLLLASLFVCALSALVWLVCHNLFQAQQERLAFAYPRLIRPQMESYRAREGQYPPTLVELQQLDDVPPLPFLLTNTSSWWRGEYWGTKDFFRFDVDWSFLGPLGATYLSEEDRWRHSS